MGDLNREHLTKLTTIRGNLKVLSETPVAAGDVSNLDKKVDGVIAEVKQYIAAEDAIRKELEAISALEAKLKPKIDALNGMRNKLVGDSTAAYNLAIPISQKLAKTPAFSKANDAIKNCMIELLGTKGTYSVKLKTDGKFDL